MTQKEKQIQKSVFIKTWGCQMNVYDSDRMREQLKTQGYREINQPQGADLVVLNTCHIREHAAEKVYSDIGRLRRFKQEKAAAGSEMLIAVAGCMAQAEGMEIIKRASEVDLVFGPQSYHRLAELLAERKITNSPVIATDFPAEEKFAALASQSTRIVTGHAVTAFLTIQEGCDKFCTFCVVPYTRGAEFSRKVAAIAAEAEQLAQKGVREITLLGQNVNAYHSADAAGKTASLAGLITALSQIEGIERIRYTTSHPRDMQKDLIAAHGENPKLMPYLHLPVQSGSNRVLKAMNRGHTADDYIKLIATMRQVRPDIAISGDFIVGFPGETEAEFEETLALIREIGYASAYSFRYSPRPGTPAASLDNQIPEDIGSERLHRLQALIQSQQTEFNQACVQRSLPVLFEKKGREPGQLVGRSPYSQPVHVQGDPADIGTIKSVTITAMGSNSLAGVIG